MEQISQQVSETLSLIERVYSKFSFPSYSLSLSTRPERNYIGSLDAWDAAEDGLKEALAATSREWSVKQGDGAFYGPKIDIEIQDAMGRSHQTATIQLDFQLPQRFGLFYKAEDGSVRPPVIIHRAILGSFERMLGILVEHTAGKWPFWLNPRQVMVIPVASKFVPYAKSLSQKIRESVAYRGGGRLFVDVDLSDNLLSKKIRDAQLSQYNYLLIVGDAEEKGNTASVRERSGKSSMMAAEDLVQLLRQRWLDRL
jgi:threonyl-tRNA synthetase